MNFADPRVDLAFKKIFGNEKHTEVLISFLNAILDFKNEKRIVELWLTNPYQTSNVRELKQTVINVKARNEKEEEFVVAIQNEFQYYFSCRKDSLYDSSKAYSSQLKKGENYHNLKPVYFVGILNFNLFETTAYLSRHLILDKVTLAQELKDFEFTFVELKKFHKTLEESQNIVDKWIYFLNHVLYLEEIPESLAFVPEIKQAFELANIRFWTKKEDDDYDYLSRELYYSEYSMNERFTQGIEKKVIEKVAKNLLAQGFDLEAISKATGLSKEQINNLT